MQDLGHLFDCYGNPIPHQGQVDGHLQIFNRWGSGFFVDKTSKGQTVVEKPGTHAQPAAVMIFVSISCASYNIYIYLVILLLSKILSFYLLLVSLYVFVRSLFFPRVPLHNHVVRSHVTSVLSIDPSSIDPQDPNPSDIHRFWTLFILGKLRALFLQIFFSRICLWSVAMSILSQLVYFYLRIVPTNQTIAMQLYDLELRALGNTKEQYTWSSSNGTNAPLPHIYVWKVDLHSRHSRSAAWPNIILVN